MSASSTTPRPEVSGGRSPWVSAGVAAAGALMIVVAREGWRLGIQITETAAVAKIGLQFIVFWPLLTALILVISRLWDTRSSAAAWLLAALFSLPALWLGIQLGEGAGLQRQGLGWLPPLVLPIAAAILVVILLVLSRKLGRAQRPVLAVAALLVGWVSAEVNAGFYVGLYAAIHDALFGLELLAFGLGLRWLLGGFLSTRAVTAPDALAGLIVSAALSWFIVPIPIELDESTRSLYGRAGLRSAQLLRWRGAESSFEGEVDRDFLARFESWNERAEGARATLPADRQWNLIWISVDTLRADRTDGKGLTPAIDALAARGARFERAYAQYPSTHLSTASMFSGRYPKATTLYRQLTGTALEGDEPERPLPALLKDEGFKTAASIAFTDKWMSHPAFSRSLRVFDLLNLERKGAPSLDARYFVESAEKSLDALRDERFFLWFHIFEPHAPYEIHEGVTKGEDTVARYEGEVAYADQQVGRLLAGLEKRGLDENTVIVFSSDHGESLGERDLRFHGSALYEPQVRVPLLLCYPGLAPQRREEIVGNVDLYPTLLDLLNLNAAPPNQGRSLVPLLEGDGSAGEAWPNVGYIELPDDVKELSAQSANVAALVNDRWKLIRHLAAGYSELYDVVADPEETRELSASEPEAKARLENLLFTMATWTKEFGRSGSLEEERAQRRSDINNRLDSADPFTRLGALADARALDPNQFVATASALAAREGEFPEIRIEALALLGEADDAKAEAAAVNSLVQSADPAIQVQALRRVLPGDPVPEIGVQTSPAARVLDELAILRFAEGVAATKEEDRTRWLSSRPGVDPYLARRAWLALALRGECDLETWEQRAAKLDRREKRRLLEHAIEADPTLFYRIAERWTRDRYLDPALRDRILDATRNLGEEERRELARHLLAGWDPGFHTRAGRIFEEAYGAEGRDRLQEARVLQDGAEDHLKSEDWPSLAAGYAKLYGAMPSSSGQRRVALNRLRYALAAEDAQAVTAAREQLAGARAAAPADDLIGRALAREFAELDQASRDALPEDAPIAVLQVLVEPGLRRLVAPGSSMILDVQVENRSDQALVRGPYAHGGRFRVLWQKKEGGETVYGDEVALTPGLLPGEQSWRRIEVRTPSLSGDWQGTIIIHQWGGPRFHVVESEKNRFLCRVVDPLAIPAAIAFEPAEIGRHFEKSAGVVGWGLAGSSGPLRALFVGYRSAFISPPFQFDGGQVALELDLAWRSASEDARHLFVRFVPIDGASPAVAEEEFAILNDGRRRTFRGPLPPLRGAYRLEIVVGGRPGVLELFGFKLD